MRAGRWFLHEHPAHATLCQTDVVEKILSEPRVTRVTCDQCRYGCEEEDGCPIKQPTRFMTNAVELARECSARCNGRGGRGGQCGNPEGGTHKQFRSKTARLAGVYHFKLCRAILVWFRRQFHHDGKCREGFVGMFNSDMENCNVAPELQIGYSDQVFEPFPLRESRRRRGNIERRIQWMGQR